MSNTDQQEFSKIRAALWPIHGDEMKKFLPMGLIMFFILFNYTILRDTKDTLVIATSGAGAAVVPFLKAWVTLPSSILFVLVYSKLANLLSRESLFYLIVGTFILFFGIFGFYLYPYRDVVHPDAATLDALQSAYPRLKYFFVMYGSWTYSIFYVLSELWGSVMISLLFWQFANEITRTREAKRFYGMFGLLANFALMASGKTVEYCSAIREALPPEVDAWGLSLKYMMSAVVVSGILVMVIYRWMNKNVLTDSKYYDAAESLSKGKQKKPKLSVSESFKYLIQSKYLGFIALLVIGYGLSIGLIEVVWKNLLHKQFPNSNDYSTFMGRFSFYTGLMTIILIMCFKGVVRRFGWFAGAVITPAMLLISGIFFFGFAFSPEVLAAPVSIITGLAPLWLTVLIGAAQNIASKGTKYALFDPTKEMAYIPLDQELKVKGKAAVDVIGGRLGKGGSGWISSMLIIALAGNVQTIAPYLAVIVIFVILAWLYAVKRLSTMYNELAPETESGSRPTGKGGSLKSAEKGATA